MRIRYPGGWPVPKNVAPVTRGMFIEKVVAPEIHVDDAFLERFLPKIEIRVVPESARPDLGACWFWIAGKDKDGYGRIQFKGKARRAHRLMFRMTKQLGNLEPDHLCRITSCVHPDHMEAVPRRVNVLRNNGVTAMQARKIRCERGHLLSGNNLLKTKSGYRICKICKRGATRRWRESNPVKARKAWQKSNRKRRKNANPA